MFALARIGQMRDPARTQAHVKQFVRFVRGALAAENGNLPREGAVRPEDICDPGRKVRIGKEDEPPGLGQPVTPHQ